MLAVKKTIIILLSLVILITLGFSLNVNTMFADVIPSIQIVKTGTWDITTNTITYTFTVTNNTSNDTLFFVGVSDSLVTNIQWVTPPTSYPPFGYELIPGQVAVAKGSYVIPAGLPATIPNVATAKGQDSSQLFGPNWTTATDDCTFYKLVVTKNTVGGDAGFDFTASKNLPNDPACSGLPAGFSITTSSGTGSRVLYVSAGVYGITEDTLSDWQLKSSSVTPSGVPGSFTVPSSDTVIVTFNNSATTHPTPELRAGALFGVGLAGLGTFAIIKRNKSKASKNA